MLHVDEVELMLEPRREAIEKLKRIVDYPIGVYPGEPEMSEFESGFLCGLLKKYRPEKILEVGVAAGGTTSIILQCMTEVRPEGFTMFSVDYSEEYWVDKTRRTGFLGDKAKETLQAEGKNFSHTFLFGKVACAFSDEIGSDIDFIILDTFHCLPGEALDFITLLPKLKNGAVVVVHDVCTNYIFDYPFSYATTVLLSSVTAEKYLNKDNTYPGHLPNIAAFIVDQSTRDNIIDLFLSMMVTWATIPSKRQLDQYRASLAANYPPEMVQLFESIIVMNYAQKNKNLHFPIELFPKNSRVVLYGRGVFGTIFHDRYFSGADARCVLAGWIDRHCIADIIEMEYDYVLIAIEKETTVNEIKEQLIALGVPAEKIVW